MVGLKFKLLNFTWKVAITERMRNTFYKFFSFLLLYLTQMSPVAYSTDQTNTARYVWEFAMLVLLLASAVKVKQ